MRQRQHVWAFGHVLRAGLHVLLQDKRCEHDPNTYGDILNEVPRLTEFRVKKMLKPATYKVSCVMTVGAQRDDVEAIVTRTSSWQRYTSRSLEVPHMVVDEIHVIVTAPHHASMDVQISGRVLANGVVKVHVNVYREGRLSLWRRLTEYVGFDHDDRPYSTVYVD
ncbi:hypothetical protein EOL96_06640 [Candidatus Saccharibacteria bacterium]|nr:hypothetical protein [Candidatus Saccharibacteria bacterium]